MCRSDPQMAQAVTFMMASRRMIVEDPERFRSECLACHATSALSCLCLRESWRLNQAGAGVVPRTARNGCGTIAVKAGGRLRRSRSRTKPYVLEREKGAGEGGTAGSSMGPSDGVRPE